MPVDDDNIHLMKTSIVEKIRANFLEQRKLSELHVTIQKIELVTVPDPTLDEPEKTKEIMPIDNAIGVTMTDERREKIYDKLVSDLAVVS